jgi:hypothetical protein
VPRGRREPAALGLRRHFEDVAVDVDLPAVIEAAKPAILVAPEGERGAAVRAMLAERAEAAGAVAKDDELLAEKAKAHGRAVALGHLFRHAGREPVPAHDLAHRPIALDAAQEIVLLVCQHGALRFALTRNSRRA